MFRSYEIDFDARIVRLELVDGSVISEPMATQTPRYDSIRRARLDIERRLLVFTLDDDTTLETELGSSGQLPQTGVPVIYLDQLHWIALAQQIWAPTRLRASEREAARSIIRLANEQRIILPMAGAHFVEMGPVLGRRRRDLATTILGLSRGWQMQNPAKVRSSEYRASMLRQDPVATSVFTREPGVLFSTGPALPRMTSGMPPEISDLLTGVVATSAVYSAMLDDEPLEIAEGQAAVARWAAGFPGLAEYMRAKRMGEDDARTNARARLVTDQREDIALAAKQAGMTTAGFAAWLADRFPVDLAQMPYVGRLAEMLYLRLRNADERWEGNDFNDINFLCTAAGYADITVGEKKTIEYLRRSQLRVRPGADLCRHLSEAIDVLTDRGITDEAEDLPLQI